MYNAYFIQHSYFLHHPLHVFWAIVLVTIILLLFWVDVLKFSKYSNGKITDPHFQEKKCDPSQSILASAYQIAQTKLGFRYQIVDCKQKQLWEAVLLFWDENIVFPGHTDWRTKHGGSDQTRTA